MGALPMAITEPVIPRLAIASTEDGAALHKGCNTRMPPIVSVLVRSALGDPILAFASHWMARIAIGRPS